MNPKAVGVQGEKAEYNDTASSTEPVPIKVTISSGKVEAHVSGFNISKHFEGTLTGEPLGGTVGLFDEKKEKIQELIEGGGTKKEEKPSSNSTPGAGGLGDIMGKMGANLPMPESFPAEDFPLVSDASIINVYEKQETKNIRIMYGTSMSYDDVLEFKGNLLLKR